VSTISSSAGAASGSSAGSAPNRYNSLSTGDFLKVMFSELTRQDPLQPSQTKDLMEQIATIRSIESNLSLSDSLKTVVHQNEVTSAGNLVGQSIKGLGDSGEALQGVVKSVSISKDGVLLNLTGGQKMQLKNMQEILGFMLGQEAA